MNKVNALFDTDKLISRPLPEQENFENEYKKLLNRVLYLMDRAFAQMDNTRRTKSNMSVNKNWAANEMNGNLWDLIAKEFPEYVKDTGRGSYYLNLNNKYECYIKKLDRRKHSLLPAYNHSVKSRQLCDQMACIDEKPIPVVFIGYTASKKMQVITGYYAVCVKDDSIVWCTDLTTLMRERKEQPNAEMPTVIPDVSVVVKQKRKAQ